MGEIMKIGVNTRFKVGALAGCILSLSLSASSGLAAVERVIVGFQPGNGNAVRGAVSNGQGRVVLDLSHHGALAVEIPSRALKGLEKNPNVVYVEEDVRRYPMAEVTPYGIPMVQANDPALTQPTSSNSKTVCIIDSGYDDGHPDLNGNNPVHTYDRGRGRYKGTGWSYTDENGHGTHVAGTIAALGNNAQGVVGVNSQGINLVIVKVFGADGWAYSSSLVAAHDVCAANGADITNMSLGGGGPTSAEQTAFANSSMLNIAAAGNDGTTGFSYPASYTSVVSVAALDSNRNLASFSQRNSEVDVAAPGVGVKSTVPRGFGSEAAVSSEAGVFQGLAMEGSPNGSATGILVDCGLGDAICAANGGAICLIERGEISFAAKVSSCEAGGGSAAILYNNEPGVLSGTLGGTASQIVALGISQADGALLATAIGNSVSVNLGPSDYDTYDGTSMATPHVAGVAALVWSQPAVMACSKSDIRSALEASAVDLGAPGRDDGFGHGLVQAKAAVDYLGTDCGNGGGGQNQAPTASFTSDCTNLNCTFSDVSNDSDGSVVSWSWNFGNGNTSTSQNPSQSYTSDGIYAVSLTVTDNEGESDSVTQDVVVNSGGENLAPTATFSSDCTNLSCEFSDASVDADGTLVSWNWNFGDGNFSSAQSPSHNYSSDGSYTVTLTVVDNNSASDSTSQGVTVSSGGGDPVFTVTIRNAGKNWTAVVASDTPFTGSFDNGSSCPTPTTRCESSPQRKKDGVMVFTPEGAAAITIVR